ncbi:hypothetical protein [Bartonella florencae]|uniref:hypothetical protein n=1 Tax=Bartonella florencae TaxID=928210 RepID=UPI0002EEE243|nr:hypothetical protein [Bartonella florencae]
MGSSSSSHDSHGASGFWDTCHPSDYIAHSAQKASRTAQTTALGMTVASIFFPEIRAVRIIGAAVLGASVTAAGDGLYEKKDQCIK